MYDKLYPFGMAVILIIVAVGVGLAICTEQLTGILGLWQWLGVAVIWSCIIMVIVSIIAVVVGGFRKV